MIIQIQYFVKTHLTHRRWVNPNHSHIIRWLTSEPRIGSREPIRGSFAYWFAQIREEIRQNSRTKSTHRNQRCESKGDSGELKNDVVTWKWEERERVKMVAAAAVWRNEEEDNEIRVGVLDGLLLHWTFFVLGFSKFGWPNELRIATHK